MSGIQPTQMRLTDEDKAILDELKLFYRLTGRTETIRYAIRSELARLKIAEKRRHRPEEKP